MNPIEKKLEKCYEYIRTKTDYKPRAAIILGSGLGDLAEGVEAAAIID